MLLILVLVSLILGFDINKRADALSFGVIGDWGSGIDPVDYMTEVVSLRRYTEVCERLSCNFTISVGDNFYCSDLDYCIRRSFEEALENVSGPFFPCTGNHDMVKGQIEYSKRNPRWYWPSRYYTVKIPIDDTGYTVQLFALDTLDNSLWKGKQFKWLKEELRRSNSRWKILFGHYPTAGSGKHERVGSVKGINQLMKEFNAQAYFSGHDHVVEINNVEGRLLALSGGMSRVPRIDRKIGGNARLFTLTNPSEYSPYKQSWGSHGFITIDLSLNTMNVNVWDSAGGMQHELVVTHDWMRKVMDLPPNKRNSWPGPDMVLQAMKSERALPFGPGGGTVFFADGSRLALSEEYENLPGSSRIPSNSSNSPQSLISDLSLTTIPDFIQYAVFTECEKCDMKPRVGKRFTLRINGETLGVKHRLYLTDRSDGCEDAQRGQYLLPGTRIETPLRNTLVFQVTQAVKKAYVCFSMDAGASYGFLFREDSVDESVAFSVTQA